MSLVGPLIRIFLERPGLAVVILTKSRKWAAGLA